MTIYAKLILPALAHMDAETAHERTIAVLALAQRSRLGRQLLRRVAGQIPPQPVSLFGLRFPSVLGVAAGFDKNVQVAPGLALLGFGHVEVGTLTPQPQAGNPQPRIFRLQQDGALINRMGFPNVGVATAVTRLQALAPYRGDFILGVSLGKQKETPLAEAAQDYVTVMRAVYPYADYLAVNISSPNTPGLRALQGGDYLGHLLSVLQAENRLLAGNGVGKRPLLVKIAPDLSSNELDEILDIVLAHGVDGLIATNTTLSREGLTDPQREEAGGLSGRPLAQRSTALITAVAQRTQGQLPIIGVGGVSTAADVRAKLDAGAALVQIYTGLIYAGPGLPGRILRTLEQR